MCVCVCVACEPLKASARGTQAACLPTCARPKASQPFTVCSNARRGSLSVQADSLAEHVLHSLGLSRASLSVA